MTINKMTIKEVEVRYFIKNKYHYEEHQHTAYDTQIR